MSAVNVYLHLEYYGGAMNMLNGNRFHLLTALTSSLSTLCKLSLLACVFSQTTKQPLKFGCILTQQHNIISILQINEAHTDNHDPPPPTC